MKTLDLIPEGLYAGEHATIELPDGLTATVKLEYDHDHDAPWDSCDGHGPVSDWRPLESKRAGERVLYTDRNSARFYDYAEAVRIARKEGWGSEGDEGLAPGAKAARAVDRDFAYLRAWCRDEWHYIGVIVTVRDAAGKQIANESCWGIESTDGYWREVAADLLDEALAQAAEHARTETLRRAFL